MNITSVILAAGGSHSDEEEILEQFIGIHDDVLSWNLKLFDFSESVVLVTRTPAKFPYSSSNRLINVLNDSGETTGSGYSLLKSNIFARVLKGEVSQVLVSYGDIIFRQGAVEAVVQSEREISIAWDSTTLVGRDIKADKRYERVYVNGGVVVNSGHLRPALANGYFVGLVKISGAALYRLAQLASADFYHFKDVTLADLCMYLSNLGFKADAIDIRDNWAQVGKENDVVRFILGTKAETLERLKDVVTFSNIEEQVSFTVQEWSESQGHICELIKSKFKSTKLIVRSSARSEDAFTHSNAGAYTSLLNIDPSNGLVNAIEEVIGSYHNLQVDDQVLVQPMLSKVVRSGVVFTRTLEMGAPYYVINYDETGATDGITAGNNNEHKTLYVRRDALNAQLARPELSPLMDALREIESLLSYDSLDVEFAMTGDSTVHILQVRPIAVHQNETIVEQDECYQFVDHAMNQWALLESGTCHNVGASPVYGVMPDWNPAEIIGTNPGKLAESLYKYLIMDETWATQRAEYGYRDVRPQPLLLTFAGKPYVDVRASFNSFIPNNISDSDAHSLVEFYLNYLKENPELHDKVEFEVIPTCLGPSFHQWRHRLIDMGGFSEGLVDEVESGLLEVTRHAVQMTGQYLEHVQVLSKRINRRRQTGAALGKRIRDVKLLLDECRLYGTLPFAHLARSGFVAATLLKEGVKEGWLSQAAMDEFMASVRTVSHELTGDAFSASTGDMHWNDFVDKYGHLRPGTYDITSPSYFDDPEKFLRPIVDTASDTRHENGSSKNWASEKDGFFEKLRGIGLHSSNSEIEQFLRDAIEGREKAKFIFSINLSEALDLLREVASDYGFSPDEWANLSWFEVVALIDSAIPKQEVTDKLKNSINVNTRLRRLSKACELPALITSSNDFLSFELTAGAPNFIGSERVITRCVHLNGEKSDGVDVHNCIVLIPQADPGYDWLFGQGIAGLITMYGGANSHMAIRSAEFGIPAAIGIGEQLYKQLAHAKEMELDPANSVMRALR